MKQKIAAILLTALALISIQQPILGYTISQSDLDAIRRNHPFYDPNASCSSSGSSSTNTGESDSEPNGPGKLFIIGDSIGSGLIGPLGTELGANWSVTGDTRVGRPLSEGITVAKSAPEGLKNAQYILVVLGTNPDNKMTQAGINEMLSAITTNNSSAKIFWLRINVTREDLVANATSFNGLLSSTSGITALDNSSILAGDGVHPSNYTELAKSIASNISSGSSNQGNTGSQSSNPCGPCPINGLSGILPVEGENAERAFKFFLSVGYTPEWAAGIVGNMIAESGVEPQRLQNTASGVITPASEAVNSKLGWGLVQWTPARKIIESVGVDKADDMGVQLDFLYKQLEGQTSAYNEKSAGDKLKQTTTVDDAAKIFMTKYERPKDQSPAAQEKRAALARGVYDKYSGVSSPTGGGNTSTSSCGGSGGGGVATVDGFTFPLKTTKGVITKGNEVGAKWCDGNFPTTNCHHDYEAGDIMVPAGTIVIAAKEGTVIRAKNSAGNCGSSVQIRDSSGQVYYYTHMANNSVPVTEGQQVSAGTVLGSVSANQHCNSSPHLHFDMPALPLSSRPSCSGAACNSYSFLDVQPILVKSYQALPE
jgi:murein DD-endopeptidase MepM/ murein hydrolase activator NlpD